MPTRSSTTSPSIDTRSSPSPAHEMTDPKNPRPRAERVNRRKRARRELSALLFVSIASVALEASADDAPKSPPPGYEPGHRKVVGLGLSPYAPQAPGLPGGTTVPFSAPAPED